MPIINSIAGMKDEITAWRRDFHEHPELMYDVHRTAGIVADKLRAFGCDEVVEGIGQTGVVGVIRGKGTSGSGTIRTIGLRADMDALPIEEVTDVEYASKTPGKMHACGHDGHTAMLLGAAKYLAETRNFSGTAVVIFQPAEEGGAGGKAMVDDGLMDRFAIDEVYGMHNMPGYPVGEFAIRSGALLASTDEFTIVIRGKGGHAAMPHLAVDPTHAAAQCVIALQSVSSRNLDPAHAMVLSVTSFETDTTAANVIADTVQLLGTVRCQSHEDRAMAKARLFALVESTAAAFGATAEIEWEDGYPPTINTHDQAMFAADAADDVAGGCLRDIPPIMPGEDFAYMLEARPGAMIFIGNGDTAQCHHPAYDFADDAIPAGASFWARLTERALPLT
ncbi:MAG: M20 aminoacylase family protein [Pseudomonadota bacterium]